jgi:hypothetical protein
MIHTADGKLHYSPRDLVSYLDGDFAAWCDRMQSERESWGTAMPDHPILRLVLAA